MKICFVAPRLHTNQHAWIDVLEKNGHEVFFLATNLGRENQQHSSFQPTLIPSKQFTWLIRLILKSTFLIFLKKPRGSLYVRPQFRFLYSKIKTINPDVVIVRDVAPTISLQAFLAAKIMNIKTILYSQHPLEDSLKFHVRIFQFLRLVPRHHITPMKKSFENNHNSKTNTYYVPLISHIASDRITSNASADKTLRIIFIGKFSLQRKKHLLMLQAFHAILSENEVRLTIIGTMDTDNPPKAYKDVQKYIKLNKLESVVDVKINLPHKQMFEEYKKHDVFALPSVDEPFSISPIEAMACSLPAIVSDTNGAKWCVQNGENGFVVESNNQIDLENALLYFTDSKKIKYCRKRAYTYVDLNHSSKVFYTLFKSAINA